MIGTIGILAFVVVDPGVEDELEPEPAEPEPAAPVFTGPGPVVALEPVPASTLVSAELVTAYC